MKYLNLLTVILVLSACEPTLSPLDVEGAPLRSRETPALDLSAFPGAKVQELVLIVFKEGYGRAEWKQVFTDTRRLARARREVELLKQSSDLDDTGRAKLDELENIKLESTISLASRDTAFMLAWSEAEACEIGTDLRLTCAATPGENPVDGGLPTFTEALTLRQPTATSIWNYPWLETTLASSEVSPGEFQIRIKLQSEEKIGNKLRLSGEAIVSEGSFFEIEKGGERVPHSKYGYIELTLELKD